MVGELEYQRGFGWHVERGVVGVKENGGAGTAFPFNCLLSPANIQAKVVGPN